MGWEKTRARQNKYGRTTYHYFEVAIEQLETKQRWTCEETVAEEREEQEKQEEQEEREEQEKEVEDFP